MTRGTVEGNLFSVFVTADVPSTFLDEFFNVNAQKIAQDTSDPEEEPLPFRFELVHSRSLIDEQMAGHKTTLPYLCGTQAPVNSTGALIAIDREDSFIGATLDDIARFIKTKIIPVDAEEIFNPDYFVVIDEDSHLDYSVTLVKIEDEWHDLVIDIETEVLKAEESKKPEWIAFARRQQAIKRSSDGGKEPLSLARVGISYCHYLLAIPCTGMCIQSLQGPCALDGVYWGPKFAEKDPPPMDQRKWDVRGSHGRTWLG